MYIINIILQFITMSIITARQQDNTNVQGILPFGKVKVQTLERPFKPATYLCN